MLGWYHQCQVKLPMVTHACTHTRMHTCTHTRMHTCTHTRMHTCTHTRMHTCTHTRMHACTHARIQAHSTVGLSDLAIHCRQHPLGSPHCLPVLWTCRDKYSMALLYARRGGGEEGRRTSGGGRRGRGRRGRRGRIGEVRGRVMEGREERWSAEMFKARLVTASRKCVHM